MKIEQMHTLPIVVEPFGDNLIHIKQENVPHDEPSLIAVRHESIPALIEALKKTLHVATRTELTGKI